MTNNRWLEQSAEIFRDIPRDVTQPNSVPEYPAAALLRAPRRVSQTFHFSLLQHEEQFLRGDGRYVPTAGNCEGHD